MLEVVSDVLQYVVQMVPMCLLALVVFLIVKPARLGRLKAHGLVSGTLREITLCLFLLFCAGLAALTLFPANIWSYVISFGRGWYDGASFFSFYPTWEQTMNGLDYLPNMLTPFQEIRRALGHMSYWGLFMLLGNIIMFMPIGFFPALLWRKWRWWKSLLTGFCSSTVIEFIQFFIGRSTDIDDVILNTAGALAGFWVFCLLRAIAPNFTEKFQCRPRGGYYHG